MKDKYIHVFCLDPDKYLDAGALLLGPYDAIGITWDYIYGYRHNSPKRFHPPDNAMLIFDEQDYWRLINPINSFYSDIEFVDENQRLASNYLKALPVYAHAQDIKP